MYVCTRPQRRSGAYSFQARTVSSYTWGSSLHCLTSNWLFFFRTIKCCLFYCETFVFFFTFCTFLYMVVRKVCSFLALYISHVFLMCSQHDTVRHSCCTANRTCLHACYILNVHYGRSFLKGKAVRKQSGRMQHERCSRHVFLNAQLRHLVRVEENTE